MEELVEDKKPVGKDLANDGLLGALDLVNLIFSEGTYQVEVKEDDKLYWVFLQVDNESVVVDQLCTCDEEAGGDGCRHAIEAKHFIFRRQEPIHVRFKDSLWNLIFMRVAEKTHCKSEAFTQDGDTYSFSKHLKLKAKSDDAREKFDEWILHRKEETEETSIKFSNLDHEEIELWREGRPRFSLQYELSCFSDLAKYFMFLEELGQVPKVTFGGLDKRLPNELIVEFEGVKAQFALERDGLMAILPRLEFYQTNIPVHPLGSLKVEKILYLEEERSLRIESSEREVKTKGSSEVSLGSWGYIPEVGFFPHKVDPILQQKVISQKDMGPFLARYRVFVETYLSNTKFYAKDHPVNYDLYFDEENRFHLQAYLFNPGDLEEELSAFFAPFAYIPKRGIYKLSNLIFGKIHEIIPSEGMVDFIEKNRNWLNQFDQFRLHLSSIESNMSYTLKADRLILQRDDSFAEKTKGVIDFGKWIYIAGEGFFSRRGIDSQKYNLRPVEVEKPFITPFIEQHKEALEQVKGFFTVDAGLDKGGLKVTYENDNIVIEPIFTFYPWAASLNPKIYGHYIYLPKKGFVEVPDTQKIPLKYDKTHLIDSEQVPYFVKHELPRLKPFILFLDKRLEEPKRLRLVLDNVVRRGKGWEMEFAYESANGRVLVNEVVRSLFAFAPYYISDAGMLHLTESRYQWLMKLPKGSINSENNKVTLSTLDWIRLTTMEDVHFRESDDPEIQENLLVLSAMKDTHLSGMPALRGFKAKLRPYQEIGLRWLWFLYTYGLSGFLCDEMGLGKTVQAMSLIAAIANEKKVSEREKFLVVAPTSVVYHWQQLLADFYPKLKVFLYHGPFRNKAELKKRHHVILTTYGILRSDKELFSKMKFELAVFDEMQIAKNQKSQIHKVLKGINSEMKLALTGTPIENQLVELKSLFDIVLPNFLPDDTEFREEFILPIEKERDQKKSQILSRLVNPFILRRKKMEVLDDLPEKIEEISVVDLTDEQRKLYQSTAASAKELVNEEGKSFYMHVFALINKLKQVCNHPALALDDVKNYKNHQSGKWDLFCELLEEVRSSGQKLVVFSQYLGMLDIIEAHLSEEGIGYAGIRGSTKNRKGEVKRFQTDPSCEVFVGSLNAAGVGIDLTKASVVIHYDRWWNPAKEDQATDRVHRIGQTRGVSVFKFVAKNSVEEHIHGLIEKKKGLITNIIGYDSSEEIKKLDRDELVLLLKSIYKDTP